MQPSNPPLPSPYITQQPPHMGAGAPHTQLLLPVSAGISPALLGAT